ncbi:hypothetical protein POM88_001634 [Heracleum sosnowskyi]|uniref:Uncharacterized protein n=1 Tax=Heracleum sosnowskyi TaxID=360622 RepID=A0AAD8JEJ7_9APIA|nr:hypothetical protein POM88_001634 [Heracleum sosnowskyi]
MDQIIILNTGHIPFGHKNTVLNMSMIELLRAAVAQDKKYVALDDGKGSYGVVFSVIDTIPTLCDNLRIIKLALALGMEQQKRYAFMYSLRCFQGFALSTFLNVHFVEHWMKCSGKYQSNNPMIKPLRLRLRRKQSGYSILSSATIASCSITNSSMLNQQ